MYMLQFYSGYGRRGGGMLDPWLGLFRTVVYSRGRGSSGPVGVIMLCS